jgi:hypothetical protein
MASSTEEPGKRLLGSRTVEDPFINQSWACRARRSRRTLEDEHRPHSATRTRSKFALTWPGSG